MKKVIKAWAHVNPHWKGNDVLFSPLSEWARILPSKAAMKRTGLGEDEQFKIVPCTITFNLPPKNTK